MKTGSFYDPDKFYAFGNAKCIDTTEDGQYTVMIGQPDVIALRSQITGRIYGFEISELIDFAVEAGIDLVKEA